VISVIVPALNEEKELEVCLSALSLQQPEENYEVIVVDGGSTDGTLSIAENYAERVIIQKSRGIGGARRDGAKIASGDKLAFTDADTVVSPDWLKIISSNLDKWDASTGPVDYPSSDIKAELIEMWRSLYRVLYISNFCYIIGANMAVNAESYWKAGAHSDISLLDDYDLSLKLFRDKARVRYDSRQVVQTSSRRVDKLLTYAALVAYGHYYYSISPDYEKLLNYPKAEEMKLSTLFPPGRRSRLEGAQAVLRDKIKRII
jgi:glycosyltransferase involved in cell wall biosynthesis